jgi:F-type H+-transporting ATPase subunit a
VEKPRKWRYGVNRWFVLLFFVLAWVATSFFPVVSPKIFVAPERLSQQPLFILPLIGPFYLTNTITTLIVVDLIVILLALAVRSSIKTDEKESNLIPHGISGAMEMLIETVFNMTESTAGRWTKTVFPWFAAILIVVLVANWLALIPGMEAVGLIEQEEKNGHAVITISPHVVGLIAEKGEYVIVPYFRSISTDLNFTIALALLSVIAAQVIGVRAQGWRYIYRFFNVRTLFSRPGFGAMDLAVSLLELISEFAKILSFSFRLFGNMFAGMVLLFLVASLIPVFMPSLVMLFEFFIGAIQAFVFGMLTLVFMSQATQGHSEEDLA